jgi:ferredoxin
MLLLTMLVTPAFAEERFPPPDFTESGYQMPEVMDDIQRTPERRSVNMPWIDLAMLAWTMLLAVYFSLVLRSRPALLTLSIICLIYFGFYRCGCICPIGAIQNISLTLFSPELYALPLVVGAFFLLPLLFALFFGRVFCAAVCPLGAIQDLVVLRPIELPNGLRTALSLIPYAYLALAVLVAGLGAGFLICEYDPFVAIFRMDGGYNMIIFGGSLLVIGLFIGRPYCRFLCPYGVLLSWLAPFARWKVKIHPENCIQCRLCEESCPFQAINPPTPEAEPARRLEGKTGLAVSLALIPIGLAIGAGLGWLGGPVLAGLHHQVALAGKVHAHEQAQARYAELLMKPGASPEDLAAPIPPDEVEAFLKHGDVPEELYNEAQHIRERFRPGGALAGAFMGLVVALKLMKLYIRRRRTGYEADGGACVSCARCYMTCPGEHARLGMVGESKSE